MNIIIIDGQGGQLGAQLIKEVTANFPNMSLTAIGTNAAATAAMLKAGAKNVATGENPVVVACRKADVIIGPIGIVIADAVRILIPVNRCDNLVAGVSASNTGALIADAVEKLKGIVTKEPLA